MLTSGIDITATQQGILKEVYETSDMSTIPQMWCMYKEVAQYYIDGVSVLTPGFGMGKQLIALDLPA
jgi:hypothetical protein